MAIASLHVWFALPDLCPFLSIFPSTTSLLRAFALHSAVAVSLGHKPSPFGAKDLLPPTAARHSGKCLKKKRGV